MSIIGPGEAEPLFGCPSHPEVPSRVSNCPGPGGDKFSEEPNEDRNRDKEEAVRRSRMQEKVACVHFMISKRSGVRVYISVTWILKTGFRLSVPWPTASQNF